jgi:hypothetical protein
MLGLSLWVWHTLALFRIAARLLIRQEFRSR